MNTQTKRYRPCAGICLKNKEGLVFAGKRFGQFNHAWQMPQGGIDKGEDHLEAAKREMFEETGVKSTKLVAVSKEWRRYDLPSHLDVEFWKGKYQGQEQLWFLFEFTGDESEIDVSGVAGEKAEFAEWAWKPIAEVTEQIVPFKKHIYEAVMAEFAEHLA